MRMRSEDKNVYKKSQQEWFLFLFSFSFKPQ